MIYRSKEGILTEVKYRDFKLEKELQILVEKTLKYYLILDSLILNLK